MAKKTTKTVDLSTMKLSTMTVAQLLSILNVHGAELGSQLSQQMSQQISKAVGALQSDMASRFLSKDDIDIGMYERLRADGASDQAAWNYKRNTTDFLIGTNNVSDQSTKQNQLNRMVEMSINHYGTTLSDERVTKAAIRYLRDAKFQQEQRHADIASENQWTDDGEILQTANLGETVKSLQVPPAATEHNQGVIERPGFKFIPLNPADVASLFSEEE